MLILVTDLPKWVQALPAALAAISAALSNIFNWKENWVRRASALELLIAEQLKYETRTSAAYDVKVDDQQALNHFVESTTSLNLMEVSNWEKTVNKGAERRTREIELLFLRRLSPSMAAAEPEKEAIYISDCLARDLQQHGATGSPVDSLNHSVGSEAAAQRRSY